MVKKILRFILLVLTLGFIDTKLRKSGYERRQSRKSRKSGYQRRTLMTSDLTREDLLCEDEDEDFVVYEKKNY